MAPASGVMPFETARIVRQPWLLPAAAAAVGWVSWLALMLAGGTSHTHHLAVTSAMSVAMMAPLGVAACQAAAHSAVWSSAARCVVTAFATFLVVWVVAGGVLHVVTEVAIVATPAWLVAGALALGCAIDAMSRSRARRLSRCAVSRPLLPRAPTLGAIDLGATAASRCLITCWAPMALTVAHPVLAAPVAGVILVERLVTPRPRWLPAAAFGLAAAVILAVNWS